MSKKLATIVTTVEDAIIEKKLQPLCLSFKNFRRGSMRHGHKNKMLRNIAVLEVMIRQNYR